MEQITYTELRENLARCLDGAVADRAPILVTRQNGRGNVVLISAAEFAGWEETMHLMRSPTNAAVLLRSIRAAENGETQEQPFAVPEQAAD